MNEIKCPKCGTVFQIDESDYDSIVKQIRNHEFEKELQEREQQHQFHEKTAVKEAIMDAEKRLEKSIHEKDLEIQDLKSKLDLTKAETALAIKTAVTDKEKEIDKLQNQLETKENEYLLKEKNLQEGFQEKIKSKEEQIEYYKDFKARQSTKMIGESLEKHCSDEFNKLRPLFPNAYFEKDNDAKSGSKGDFIFRDYEDGVEFVSIMFEMKNEADETATKHKNEDFLKELDKDRREKNCEYAVLVSLLEIDNEYYNTGIVDVSHRYPKMYIIRPQFFIPIITLIRGLAQHSLQYKKELQIVKEQNLDIAHFEENVNAFKEAFGRNYRLASERFQKAIEEIDKTIDHLQKTKDALLSSENNLRLANHKAEDLTIKKLTHNSETVQKMFEDEKKKKEKEN